MNPKHSCGTPGQLVFHDVGIFHCLPCNKKFCAQHIAANVFASAGSAGISYYCQQCREEEMAEKDADSVHSSESFSAAVSPSVVSTTEHIQCSDCRQALAADEQFALTLDEKCLTCWVSHILFGPVVTQLQDMLRLINTIVTKKMDNRVPLPQRMLDPQMLSMLKLSFLLPYPSSILEDDSYYSFLTSKQVLHLPIHQWVKNTVITPIVTKIKPLLANPDSGLVICPNHPDFKPAIYNTNIKQFQPITFEMHPEEFIQAIFHHIIDQDSLARPCPCRCGKAFVNTSILNIHLQSHIEDQTFNCQKCSKVFTQIKYLQKHDQQVHHPQNHTCYICNASLANSKSLRLHISGHENRRQYICVKCKKGFNTSDALAIHSKSHQLMQDRQYKCHECHKVFATPAGRKKHETEVHERRVFIICTMENTGCDCGAEWTNKAAFDEHAARVMQIKNFKCPVPDCGDEFVSKKELTSHTTNKHTNIKNHICITCGNGFKQPGDLLVHMRIHTGEKPFKCSFCEKLFRANTDMRKHEKIHSNVRDHKCTFCSKEFLLEHQLKDHENIHTGEKPYSCPKCGERFNNSGSFSKHKKKCVSKT